MSQKALMVKQQSSTNKPASLDFIITISADILYNNDYITDNNNYILTLRIMKKQKKLKSKLFMTIINK